MERCVVEVVGEVPTWASSPSEGHGDGEGDGYGHGYGSAYGYPSRYGEGYGYGDAYGFGSSNGEGEGSGDGYGYGHGYGHGDGDGYGYGTASYWQAAIPHFAAKWPEPQQTRFADLSAQGATIAYWRSDAAGRPCNGGRAEPVYPGLVQTAPGPLLLCHAGTLHATLNPDEWQGKRWWIVALIGEVVHDESKMGALTREIIGEAL
jgi:hypothetical protein